MFDLCSNIHENSFDRSTHASHAYLLNQAISQFNRARWAGFIEKAKSALLHHSRTLLDIESIPQTQVRARHHGGTKPVSIDKICGSLGRAGDFNKQFHPLSDRIQDRWVNIAIARSQNLPLAPVELIQVGDCYFVKDGHHRISVARTLGETMIDAEITIWEVCCPLPWDAQPAAPIIPQTA